MQHPLLRSKASLAALALALVTAWAPSGCSFSADLSAASGEKGGGESVPPPAGGGGGEGGQAGGSDVALSASGGGAEAAPGFSDLCGSGLPCQPGGLQCPARNVGPEAPADGCYLAPDGSGGVEASCAPAGTRLAEEPCATSTDCLPDHGCVATSTGGVCRPYCCGDVEACPENTFCALRPVFEDAQGNPPSRVPVCSPIAPCEPLAAKTGCPEGQACTVLRADGTAGCTEAGAGTRGEPCPCAEGFVCSKSANTCKQLCHLDAKEDLAECPEGSFCLGGGEGYPEGIGVCSSE